MTRKEAIISGAASLSALAMAAQSGRAEEPAGANPEEGAEPNPEITKIRALVKAHDEAMTNHDLSGVMKCLTENAAIMGTGPGEFWVGPEEIKTAYEHFFETFDKGAQDFEYQFKIGGVATDMGWLMASGNVTAKKDAKEFTFPMNISLTAAKKSDEWRIAALHFSTLTGDTGTQEKTT
jgi:uncharacterized protein (TIGR02246 family)